MIVKKLLRAAVIAGCVLGARAQESAPAAATASAPDLQHQSLRNAERLGASIFRQDRAAALATDSALELRKFRRDKRLGGWLIDEAADGYHVTFFGTTDALPLAALYRVRVSPEGDRADIAITVEPPEPLTAEESLQYKVRQFALAQEFAPCSKQYNTVVLRQLNAEGEHWVVYLLAATTDAKQIPAGGHYRFDINADGTKVLNHRAFTRSCLSLERPGKNVVGLTLSHLLDDHPTEIHVFINLTARIPLYVFAGKGIWKVEDGAIQLVKDREEPES